MNMYLTKTPLRVSLFGGGTDYPDYFLKNAGAVIGGTINKFIYTSALPLFPSSAEALRLSYRVTESVQDIIDLEHPIVREWLLRNPLPGRYSISTVSDIPGGTGLGSSSAFSVGFIELVDFVKGSHRSKESLARAAIDLERNILEEPVGWQDQYHAAYGGFSKYEFSSDSVKVQNLSFDEQSFKTLSSSCYLVFVGEYRRAASVLGAQVERTKSGVNSSYLDQMTQICDEAFSIIQNPEVGWIKSIGHLLNESWKLKSNLAKNVSNDKVENIISGLMSEGCFGAKLLGAGGCGFVLGIGPEGLQDSLIARFGRANVVDFSFINTGVERLSL